MKNKKNNNKRGETFVGYRANVIRNGKDKANTRQAIKRATEKRIREDHDGR